MTTMETELQNPLKRIRIQELGKTPELLAKEAGIQLAAIGQAEEGFYPNPLPSYLQAIGITPGSFDADQITEEYHEFQLARRKSNGPNGNPKLILDPFFNLDQHPMLTWRRLSGLSVYGFCSAYCVHMPSLNNFEKNILNMTTIPPKNIVEALTDAEYDLTEFIEACQLYKRRQLNLIRSVNELPPEK